MSKKKENRKRSEREMNVFPYLSLSLDDRLLLSGAVPFIGNPLIIEDGNYWTIKPTSSPGMEEDSGLNRKVVE